MELSKELLKQLREETGAGVVDIKQALDATQGDPVKAQELLRKQGKKVAAKKSDRITREGVIGSYIHANGKIAALVALACETDFVARNETFQALAHDLALHVAATNPTYLTPDEVPADILAKEREIATEQANAEGKPAAIIEKIIEGKLQKFYDEQCLLRQTFVKDDRVTIAELLEQAVAKIGEKIELQRFVRMQL